MDIISNVLAFFLPLAVFSYWLLIGYATLSLLHSQRNLLQNILLAPAVGFAINILFVFWLSRWGLPVKDFALFLALVLLVMSSLVLIKTKPYLSWRSYSAFLSLLILGLFLTGMPLLKFGFNWLSYGNDDMANYCLGATFFQNQGFSALPQVNNVIQGKDYSQIYSFLFNVPVMGRPGAELLLAWLSVVVAHSPTQVFMPLILALYLTLLSVTGAMVYQSRFYRSKALTVCLLLVFSALTTLSVLYQLIAQVGGLSLLIAASILLCQPFKAHYKYVALRQSILISLILTGLAIYYPEISPFLVLGLIFYFSLSLLTGWWPTSSFLKTMFLCALFSAFFLNSYFLNLFRFLKLQIGHGTSSGLAGLFPYFLIPSGLADLWGMQSIGRIPSEPWLSISIALAALLTVVVVSWAFSQAKKKNIPALIAIGMFIFSLFLFKVHSGFGTFKIAMFMQPFLCCVVTAGVFTVFKNNLSRGLAVVLIILLGQNAQIEYIKSSFGAIGNLFVELPKASKLGLFQELNRYSQQLPENASVAISEGNVVSAKYVAASLLGKNVNYYSNTFFITTLEHMFLGDLEAIKPFIADRLALSEKIKAKIDNEVVKLQFAIHRPHAVDLKDEFYQPKIPLQHNEYLLIDTANRELFNGRNSKEKQSNYELLPLSSVSNYLVFVNSKLGQHYYFGEDNLVSVNNFENDYFYKNVPMAGIGRYVLFQLVNPSPKTRLELSMTTSLNHDGDNSLPPAAIVGRGRKALPMVGRGSARVFVETEAFQPILKAPYLMIDMGREGKAFPSHFNGLMKLYGDSLHLDRRLLIGFVRDISLVSEEEYQKMILPEAINKFPDDLANPNLEYSGVYEDGWISENSYFYLEQPNAHANFHIRGVLPKLDAGFKGQVINVYVDNKKIFSKALTIGDFDDEIPVSYKKGRRKIELRFAEVQNLGKGDGRPVSARIYSLGFGSA